MKNTRLSALLAIVVIVFSSCSNEESTVIEGNQTGLLKTYKVKRDATGAYSVDFNVSENTKVEELNDDSKSEFLLFSSDVATKKAFSEDLLISDSQLKISFVDVQSSKESVVSILDDDIKLQRKGEDSKLAGYSVQGNEDGTINLDFEVNNNVDVSFVYNEEINTYEVHLENGNGNVSSFSRTLEKITGEALKIDFVNHNSNANAKSDELVMVRKPKIIVQD